ncbi:MAG: MoaD/ThiS family protein [Chloroflexi bacterium]|nr:MoaD/ThiS family protein [Chloroflexota bacterium]
MSAKLHALGIIKSYIGGKSEIVVDAGNTIRETMRALNIPSEIVALVLVNDAPQAKEYRVQAGDVIKLIAVVGGGVNEFRNE